MKRRAFGTLCILSQKYILRVLENELNRFDELAEIIQSQGMGHMTR